MAGLESVTFGARRDEGARQDEDRHRPHGRGAARPHCPWRPGWRWSDCIKPVAGTDSCQAHHVGVVLAGTLHVAHEDGSEQDIGAGSAYVIEPGHDAWVVGDEAVVGYEFDARTAEDYAKG